MIKLKFHNNEIDILVYFYMGNWILAEHTAGHRLSSTFFRGDQYLDFIITDAENIT